MGLRFKVIWTRVIQGLAFDEVHVKVVREDNLLSGFEGRQSAVRAPSAAESISKGARATRGVNSGVFEHGQSYLGARILSLGFSASTVAILARLLGSTDFAIVNQGGLGKIGGAQQGGLVDQLLISGRRRAPRISDRLLLELNSLRGSSRIVGLLGGDLEKAKGGTERQKSVSFKPVATLLVNL